MKEFRPLILWVLILGIAFAVWNNFSSKQQEKPQHPILPQASLPKPIPLRSSSFGGQAAQSPKPTAQSSQPQKRFFYLKEFGVLAGFAKGDLKEKDDYELILVIFRFGFDLKGDSKKNNPKDLLELEIEPFISGVISPDDNIEAGTAILVKYGRYIFEKVCLYIEAGTGVIYLTQKTREQATEFNFVDQAGGGMQYFIKKNTAINIGYRFRHISNGSIKHPNNGIDSNMFLAGISRFF